MPVRWSLIDQVGNEGYDAFYDNSSASSKSIEDLRAFSHRTLRTLYRCNEHLRRVPVVTLRKSSREKESRSIRTLIMHRFRTGSDISNDIESKETLATRFNILFTRRINPRTLLR